MTDRIAPDYSKHVKTPMYLNLIKSKLKSGAYDSLQSFDQDARLMFDNCVLYNGDGSYFGVVSVFCRAARDHSSLTLFLSVGSMRWG